MGLIVKIGANIKDFDKQMKKLTSDVNAVGNKLKDVGSTLTKGVTLPLAAVGAISIKTGMDFEAAMSQVAALSGATGDELASLEQKAREMGSTTQFSAKESADAMAFMAMAGWETHQILDGLDGVMALAAASGEDLAKVSDIVTDSMTAFGLQAADSGKFADLLASAASNANTTVSMLGDSFSYVAPVAGALGFTAEDTSKALALMANAGIKGSQSGTALRTMMTNLANPTAKMEKAMNELGISITDNDGNMKSLDDIMGDLRNSFSGLDQDQQAAYAATIFGKEAMSGALAIVNASEQDYNKLSDAINNSEGAAQSMADTMNNNLTGKFKEVKSAFEEVGLVIYENLKPGLEFIATIAKNVADSFNNLSPKTQQLIIGLAGVAAAIGPLLLAVGTGLMLFAKLKATLAILQLSFMAVSWPILAVIAALAAIVAVVVYWEEIKTFFINLWDKLKEVFGKALDWLDSKTNGTFSKIVDFIKMYLNMGLDNVKAIWEYLKNTFKNALDFLKALVKGDFQGMKDAIGNQMENAKGLITNIWNNIKTFLNNAFGGIITNAKNKFTELKNNASTMFNNIKNVITKPVDDVKNKVSSAFSSMKDTALGAWEGLKNGMKGVINNIIRLVNKFINGFNGPAKLLNKIPGVDAPLIPQIPLLAKGGNLFGSGSAIVGEAGPELVQKSGSSVKVTPLSAQEKSGGIGGALGGIGGKIEIPLYLNGYEIARASYDHINEMMESDLSNKLMFSGVR